LSKCKAQQEHFGPLLGYCDHQMMKLMVRKLRRYDVSPMQCRTLTFLKEQQQDVTQKTLQEFLRVKPSTVNGIVERLEEKHLLTRSVSPGDGRCKLLHLTEEGQYFYQEFIAIMESVHRQAEQGFSAEEVKLLQGFLHRVADNLSRETEETHT
jgi:DNA-binding MarR family transcriptional regulator